MIYSGVQLDELPFIVLTPTGTAYTGPTPPDMYVKSGTADSAQAANAAVHDRGALWQITLTAAEMTAPNKLVTIYWEGSGIAPGRMTIPVETEIDSLSEIGALTGPNSVTLTFEDSNGD